MIIGCANPEGATGGNIARQIAIRAGCPVDDRRHHREPLLLVRPADDRDGRAAHRDRRGRDLRGRRRRVDLLRPERDEQAHVHRGLAASQNKPEVYWPMLETAEYVAKSYGIPREEQDEYGVRSQQRAAAARDAGQVQGRDRRRSRRTMKVVDKATGVETLKEVTASRRTRASAPTRPTRACRRSSRRSRAASSPPATRASSPTGPRPAS